LVPQEAQAWRSTRAVSGVLPLKVGTFTLTNSDLQVAHFMAATGAPAVTAGAFSNAEAPPLVMTSARAAVALRRAAMVNVMMVFIFSSFSFLLAIHFAFLNCLRALAKNHSAIFWRKLSVFCPRIEGVVVLGRQS
jgi:hypothetical protein